MTDLDSAREEWGQLEEIVPKFRGEEDNGGNNGDNDVGKEEGNNRRETTLITAELVVDHFSRKIIDRPRTNEVLIRLRRKRRFQDLACIHCCIPNQPGPDTLDNMSMVMAFTQTPFDDTDPICLQMLLTLYKQLTGDRVDCPRYGSHWEQIGFQGNDPSTDLRGVGLLGLLQPLFVATTPELFPFAQKVYRISLAEEQNFPLLVLSINLTRIAYDALMDGLLNRLFKDGSDFWYNFNFFYSAVLYHFYRIWKTEHKTIKDSGYVLKDTEKYCRKNVMATLEAFSQHLLTYSVEEKQAARDNLNKRTVINAS